MSLEVQNKELQMFLKLKSKKKKKQSKKRKKRNNDVLF